MDVFCEKLIWIGFDPEKKLWIFLTLCFFYTTEAIVKINIIVQKIGD